MNIPLCFFISLGVCAVGLIAAFINFLTALKSLDVSRILTIHIIAGAFYVLGGLSSIVFGIMWIVTYLKN